MRRKWDVSTKQVREKCVNEILARIKEQEDAEFGVLAAEEVIDIVAQNIGPDIYNLAIKDSKKLILDRVSDLDIELDLLKNDS